MKRRVLFRSIAFVLIGCTQIPAQTDVPAITLREAISRARLHGGQLQAANQAVQLAIEDRRQARTLRLPTLNALNQGLYTQGNGTDSGVYVSNNGVHVYTEQAQIHQDLFAMFRGGEVRRAAAAEAAARARVDIAARGLNAVVIQNYYAVIGAEQRLANNEVSVQEAQRFVAVTQQQEAGGEAAHADVIRARLLLQQRQRDVQDSLVAIEKARISLGVLIFPSLRTDFTLADESSAIETLPLPDETRARAKFNNPDVRVAQSLLSVASHDVAVARYGYLPTFSIDLNYGIDANRFAVRGGAGDPDRQNLGYSLQFSLNIPVWNWGLTQSRVRQAELRRSQAALDVTIASRTLEANLAIAMAEARAAGQQMDSLRASVDLAAESLRLTLLRYQAGEALTLEVVDAQSTIAQARNSYGDGVVRYKIAMGTLQTIMGAL